MLTVLSPSALSDRGFSRSLMPITRMNSSQSIEPEPSVSTSAKRSFSSWSVSCLAFFPLMPSSPTADIPRHCRGETALNFENSWVLRTVGHGRMLPFTVLYPSVKLFEVDGAVPRGVHPTHRLLEGLARKWLAEHG